MALANTIDTQEAKEPAEKSAKPGKTEKAPRPSAAAMPAEEGGEEASPEEQDIFSRIELAALTMLYDDKTHGEFVNMLKAGAQQPAQTLATTALTIFGEIDRQSGGKVPEEMIIPALVEGVLGAVVDMAEKTRVMPVDEAVAGKAVQELLLLATQQYDIDPAEIEQAMAQMDPAQQQAMVQQQQQFAGA
jgi:hypothetical protein